MTMKRTVFVLAFAAATMVAQAARFNWVASGTANSKTFYAVDGVTKATPGLTVYLFSTTDLDRASLVEGMRAEGASISDFTSIATSTLDENSRLVSGVEFAYGEVGTTYSFYMAIVDGDNMFVSNTANAHGQASDIPSVSFAAIKAATQTNLGKAAFSTGGWYAVPEPTSGLLALLGFAGLALHRRRA